MSQEIKETKEEKAARETKEANEKALKEQNAKVSQQNLTLRAQRAEKQKKKGYIPKDGTGKHFHIKAEVVGFNKNGEKTSESRVIVLDFKSFSMWIQNAGRLGFSFGMVHDPSMFYTEQQRKELKEKLKSYATTISLGSFKFGVEKAQFADQKTFINDILKSFYKKVSAKYQAEKQKREEPKHFLD